MKKSHLILLVTAAAVALIGTFLIQRRAEATLRQNDDSLRQQQDDIVRMAAENQRLSNRVAQAGQGTDVNSHATDVAAELAQLQTKATALRSQENQLSNQLWTGRVSAGERLLASENYNLTNHNDTIAATIGGGPRATSSRLNDARAFTAGIQQYAREHGGEFPLSLDQVTSYLPQPLDQNSGSWENAPVSGTNEFEIVYQGGTNEFASIPLRRIALIRERQAWLAPDGKWARTYGYADGGGEIVTSDDNFQSWDALHIIPPSANP